MNGAPRYIAQNLGSTLDAQGRKRRWLAHQVGVSESLISKVIAGERTVDHALAERITAIVGIPFFLLFDLHERNESVSQAEHAA